MGDITRDELKNMGAGKRGELKRFGRLLEEQLYPETQDTKVLIQAKVFNQRITLKPILSELQKQRDAAVAANDLDEIAELDMIIKEAKKETAGKRRRLPT